jgi:hypothetical protein
MFYNSLHFTISFCRMPTPVWEVWECFHAYVKRKNLMPKQVRLAKWVGIPKELIEEREQRLPPHEIGETMMLNRQTAFYTWLGQDPHEIRLNLTDLTKWNKGQQAVLHCTLDGNAKAPEVWNEMIEDIVNKWRFIAAFQPQNHYRVWQSCNGVVNYELWFGKMPSYRTYIKKSVDSISPDRDLLDVSKNPGRSKEILPTVYFYPTAEMWLGPDFWQYAKCTKEEVLAADFFLEKRDTEHYLYVKCWPTAFTRPDGEQGRMQQRLWKLFFNEDCEWPPGSGGISDEAVYGPFELLPVPHAHLYRAWQNETKLEGYTETYGPLPTGLKTLKSKNKAKSAAQRETIDISLNPGRGKEFYPGYTFHIAAEMWLDAVFWSRAKCTKEEVLAADFFMEKRDTEDYLYVKCWPTHFTRPDGEQGRMQQRLWKLFFHEDCEWPPGSGSICDEPIYGPPELMPGYQPPEKT